MMNSFSPANPFVHTAVLVGIDPATGAELPITSGPVTGFFVATDLAVVEPPPDAGPAHASLSVAGVYIGAQPKRAQGTWLFPVPANVMVPALLDGLFVGKRAFFVYEKVGARRVFEELRYRRAEPASVR